MREQLITAAAVFPFLALLDSSTSWRKRWMAILLHTLTYVVLVVAVMWIVGALEPGYWNRILRWASVVRLVSHDLWGQFFSLVKFSLANGLLAFVGALLTFPWWKRMNRVRAIAMGMGVLPLLALLPNGDLGIQPRYEIIAVPALILASVVGIRQLLMSGLKTWKKPLLGILVVLQCSLLLGGLVILHRFNRMSLERKVRVEKLLTFAPPDAVFVCGAYTPILEFVRQSGVRPHWEVIRSGWDWPGRTLDERVQEVLDSRREVLLLDDGRAWDYLQDEWEDVQRLRSRFQFVPVDPGEEQVTAKANSAAVK